MEEASEASYEKMKQKTKLEERKRSISPWHYLTQWRFMLWLLAGGAIIILPVVAVELIFHGVGFDYTYVNLLLIGTAASSPLVWAGVEHSIKLGGDYRRELFLSLIVVSSVLVLVWDLCLSAFGLFQSFIFLRFLLVGYVIFYGWLAIFLLVESKKLILSQMALILVAIILL